MVRRVAEIAVEVLATYYSQFRNRELSFSKMSSCLRQ
jgi:hypothetical protein